MSWPYGRAWAALVERTVGSGTVPCTIRLPHVCTRVATTLDHHPVPVDTIKARRPELDSLALDPANLRPACRPCNTSLGTVVRTRKARARRAKRASACEYHGESCGGTHSREW